MKLSAISVLCLVMSGCVGPANPPSLMPRAIEAQANAPPPAPPVAVQKQIDASMAAKLAASIAEANAGDTDFLKADQGGMNTILAGNRAPEGSEAWVAAEVARSALQVARQRSAGALAEIDALAIAHAEAALRDPTIGGSAEIAAAQTGIETIVTRQTARLEALNR